MARLTSLLRLLLLVPLASPSRVMALPQLMAPDIGASDGSGVAPYRNSAPFLLFTIVSLLVGAGLLVAGKRMFRTTTALGAGLLLELLVWVCIVNTLSSQGLASSAKTSDLILWTIVTVGGLVGLTVGGYFWRVGMGAMCICGGMSLGFSITMMAEGALPVVARWIIIGVLSLLALLLCPFTQKNVGMAIATSMTGSFLLFLGIDLLANQTNGMSLGLRYMLDGNRRHAAELARYDPPVVTRVLLAVSWVVAFIAALLQAKFWPGPFIRTPEHLSHARLASANDQEKAHPTSPTPPQGRSPDPEPAESFRTRMNRRYRERLAKGEKEMAEGHYSEGSEVSADALRAHLKDLSGLTSPDEPPTRPNSVVSTEFANQLRSRPPTFFNEPLASPVPAQPPTSIPPSDLSTFVTQIIPVVGVGAAAAPPLPEPIAVPLVKKDSGSSSKSSSRESCMSWRKAPPPFPTMVLTGTEGKEDDQTDSAETEQLAHVKANPHSHGFINDHDRVGRGLASGLQTGREYALRAPTVSTPCSGEVSALLKSDFGHTPPLPRDEDITSHSFFTGPRGSMDSSVAPTELLLANNPHTELVPLTVSPPSDEALRHRSYPIEMAAPTPSSVRTGTTSDASAPRASFDGAESFRTAESVEVGYFGRAGEGGTPELVRDDDETVTSLASPVTGGSGSAVGMQEAFGAGGGKLGREQEEEQVERLRM